MKDVIIVSGAKTTVGSFDGALKSTPMVEMGALVLKETLKKVGLKTVAGKELTRFERNFLTGREQVNLGRKAYDYNDSLQSVQVDEVIIGNVVGAGQGQNVDRQAMIKAGISKETNAFTPSTRSLLRE